MTKPAPDCILELYTHLSNERLMGAAVAIILRKEHDIVSAFRGAGATSPAAARSPEELGIDTRVAFHRLVTRAIIRDAGDGCFYLDEPGWHALRGMRRRIMITLLIVVFALVLLGVVTSGAVLGR